MPTLTTKASPVFNPADFVLGVDNPYMTLQPGTTYVYKNDGTDETVYTETTRQTKLIDGVVCTVVHDRSFTDGELSEDTFDYFAQDKSGNVWYFGEDTKELEDGKVVSTEGTWRAGVDGATPGIVMEASPQAGDKYQQEHAEGVAEDMAKVITLSALVDAPYASSGNALETDEFTPLEPDLLVGIESRGFLVAAPLSYLMGCGFVMVRKRGKLPGDVIQHHYDLEYGTDTVEIQADAIKKGQRVVVLDDLLATGGTLQAAITLLRKVGGNVVGAACIIELAFLSGRAKLDVPFRSMISYEA
jgi:adenine phosphoribosyltransferase